MPMKNYLKGIIFCCLLFPDRSFAQKKDYLFYVKEHCDQLITHGKDVYGDKKSDLLASIIDTRDMSVPKWKVPPTEGTRSSDRAVGGSNYYHDVQTITLLNSLTKLTGDTKYKSAATNYTDDFLTLCQNPYTGLLGWGEHLYYNFYADSVREGDLDQPGIFLTHEFLETTPPWTRLWETDSARITKAIIGVRGHFRSPVTQSFLYNRHARWNKIAKPEYRGLEQYQDGGQAWIKHSGLQCYSFTFLYKKTGNPEWKRWAEGTGTLFWKYRNPATNLTISCIDDPRPSGMYANINSMGLLSYYLLKSWQVDPRFDHFRKQAETMLKSVEKYSWDKTRNGYVTELYLDGNVFNKELVKVVETGYGNADILLFGRIAAYFYKVTGDRAYLEIVKKISGMLLKHSWPDTFVVNSLASALQFSMDAYEVTKDPKMLELAKSYADTGINKLWSGKLFVREPKDPYYEAKLGTSDLVAGMLRLHLVQNSKPEDAGLLQWSL